MVVLVAIMVTKIGRVETRIDTDLTSVRYRERERGGGGGGGGRDEEEEREIKIIHDIVLL